MTTDVYGPRECARLLSTSNTRRPPLWSNGKSFWLQIKRSGFDSRLYHIFWEVVDLERGRLSLVSTIEELLERKYNGSGLENRDYGRRGSAALTTRTFLYPRKFALTSPTNDSLSVGIVRSRTKATELLLIPEQIILGLNLDIKFCAVRTCNWQVVGGEGPE
jgi:hypothetical protein